MKFVRNTKRQFHLYILPLAIYNLASNVFEHLAQSFFQLDAFDSRSQGPLFVIAMKQSHFDLLFNRKNIIPDSVSKVQTCFGNISQEHWLNFIIQIDLTAVNIAIRNSQKSDSNQALKIGKSYKPTKHCLNSKQVL